MSLDTENLARELRGELVLAQAEANSIENLLNEAKCVAGIRELEIKLAIASQKAAAIDGMIESVQKLCDHKWYNDQPQTVWSPCLKCGISFGDWANERIS